MKQYLYLFIILNINSIQINIIINLCVKNTKLEKYHYKLLYIYY